MLAQKKINFLKDVFHASKNQCLPIVFWKKPNQKKITINIQLHSKIQTLHHNYINIKSGFIFSPFEKKNDIYYIQPDIKIHVGKKNICIVENNKNNIKKLLYGNKKKIHKQSEKNIQSTTQETYLKLIKKAQHKIQRKQLQKVVTSIRTVVNLPDKFDLVMAFLKKCQKVYNGFLVLLYTKQYGTWLGESPEELFTIFEKKKEISTVALAGTQKINDKSKPIIWKEKEYEEQKIVSKYIESFFKKNVRGSRLNKQGPHTIIHNHLAHLKTKYICQFKTEKNFFLSLFLQKYAPTPAVAGLPQNLAIDFILNHEQEKRNLYSGFWGPIERNKKSSIFVNLRCMEIIHQKKAVIYSGGGITKASDPIKEWEEVKHKYQSIYKNFIYTI